MKTRLFIFIVVALLCTGCVKFDDPVIPEPSAPIDYSSPCSNELTDNYGEVYTVTDFLVSTYDYSNAICSSTLINGNIGSGEFEIELGEPITESGTLDFGIFPPGSGEARLSFNGGSFQPEFVSNSGTLYIDMTSSGDIILEWCEVICQTVGQVGNQKSTGRIICN